MTTVARTQFPAIAANLEKWLPVAGRVLIAAIFLLSGFSKIADPAGSIAYIQSVGLPLPAFALAGAIAVEIVGSLLLIAGYRVRAVATVIALFSVATAVFFHNNLADQNQFIHFFKNIAIAGGLLQIAAFGSGRD
ncbi:DoxX family protein [Novosphingobium album (ex Hu et al. 2023)]|uniref:DoxX family protein n=1 Tax=Novosphingobium album (ex Hu et al. 2023) TaxID=2930093 RepID=A0ABT0B161_9SPHN|nr:DoxX family protein [Novosphingobium album (ex Hu et al. 2023)]MCJ2178806.1 DoxX family protein [Novosphingobium album (ex Hu et al. 2023)]